MKISELLCEVSAPRLWYHGTTKPRFEKIKQAGYLKPQLADDESFGHAVWFTSDINYANEIANKRGIVLVLKHSDLKQFKHKRISPYPYGFKKKGYWDGSPMEYHLVIFEKVPLNFLSILEKHK